MITYRTTLLHVRPSPLGLVLARWVVDHTCTPCRERVPADELVAHAKDHEEHRTATTMLDGARCHDHDQGDRRR